MYYPFACHLNCNIVLPRTGKVGREGTNAYDELMESYDVQDLRIVIIVENNRSYEN